MKIRIGLMPTRREIFAPENAKKEVEPFIHHWAGVYGHYFAEMREIARYLQGLGTHPTVFFEYPEKEGYYSL